MEVYRTLHPVGQGAFYSEEFYTDDGTFTAIFDCGGTNGFIQECVERFCYKIDACESAKKPVIDAVFISHFDDDHVNGLEKLFEIAHVKRIFMPLLDDSKILAISYSFLNKLGSPLYKSLLNTAVNGEPFRYEGQEIAVIRIKEDNNDRLDENEYLNSNNIRPGDVRTLSGGVPVQFSRGISWIFKTFNYDNGNSLKTEKLKSALNSFGYRLSLNEIMNKWSSDPNYQENIRECYKKVRGSINGNSMVTYSGPKDSKNCYGLDVLFPCHLINCKCHYDYCELRMGRAGCMYMGDYEAKGKRKWAQYESNFEKEIPLLHMQQLPHHGAYRNYNDRLNNIVKLNFVSAGKGNSYGHPSNSVLQSLNNDRIPWLWIHEYSFPMTFNYYCIR